ncbi:MAG: hypothetical protein LUG18_09400 [Candidatus Azobacteroides sp.]|nr:hypothetical protein [Candidatus Azobacteroides sp.]
MIENTFIDLQKFIVSIDFNNYKEAYKYALEISKYSWELALIIMINIIKQDPDYFDERIRDSIYLYLHAEGNSTIWSYISKLLAKETNEETRMYLNDMIEILEIKYHKLGIYINKQ